MNKARVAWFAATLALIAGNTAGQDAPIAFAPGQEWTIKAEPPSAIKVVVGRIEPFGKAVAVSVTLLDVPCPEGMGCTTTSVAHAPFDEQALEKSVDKMIATGVSPSPQFEEGYANWKAAKGGVFIVGVAQVPDLLFQAIQHGTRHAMDNPSGQ